MFDNLSSQRRAVVGLILLAVGFLLLGVQVFGDLSNYLWPLFIIIPGAVLALMGLSSGGTARKLAVPGTTIAGVGLILFVQNLFNHYESWAYAWALIPFFVGIGMALAADDDAGEGGTEAARNLMTWAIAVFVIMGAIFEIFIFGGGGVLGARFLVPAVLIVLGAAFLLGWIAPDTRGHGHKGDG
ncbi:MAG: hypothetical protein HKO95_08480 [Rhodobacteraceae bacterium]|nr:hypothetical protein [Alphaproteobacteria bacterium]MBT8476382.1 hypothetical protein [Alphaproteobacteria bacterium]NNF72860.1 hypothetical protein [Paracoccaceae bacterium]NNK66759.1 hypothetical protein [Paracoccaceae bacterium]